MSDSVTPWTVACQAPLSMGILQARILEWVAMPSSRGCSQTRDLFSSVQLLSCVQLFEIPWFSIHGILQARILEWVAMPFSRGIFPPQGSNPGLPHCRWILYRLSQQGNPRICVIFFVCHITVSEESLFSIVWAIPSLGQVRMDAAAAAAAKSLQSCPTLCDPIDGSPPGSPFPGILQARTLEWVAISFSNACNWKVKVKSLSRVQLAATPGAAAYQAPPSMGFSRQEYWSGVPLPFL